MHPLGPASSTPFARSPEESFEEIEEFKAIEGSTIPTTEEGTHSTMESMNPTTNTSKTQPGCLTGCLNYIGMQIVDFFDWVCSLFCRSKPVTLEQFEKIARLPLEETDKQLKRIGLLRETNTSLVDMSENPIVKRFKNISGDSSGDFGIFAEGIEVMSNIVPIVSISYKLQTYRDKLQNGGQSDEIYTERSLKLDIRKLTNLCNEFELQNQANSPIPQNSPIKNKETVIAYCLGKTTVVNPKSGKTVSCVDCCTGKAFEFWSLDLRKKFDAVIEQIRFPILKQYKEQIEALENQIATRYETITKESIQEEDQALHCLVDAIEVLELYTPLFEKTGDISEDSLKNRITAVKERIDPKTHPLFAEKASKVTPEMRTKLQMTNRSTLSNACNQISGYVERKSGFNVTGTGQEAEAMAVKDRLEKVIDNIQKEDV